MASQRLSVSRALQDRTILITGGAGFLGKVLLSLLLSEVPHIGRVVLVLRASRSESAQARLARLFAESPAFSPVRDRFGTDQLHELPMRIEAMAGDVTKPQLGLTDAQLAELSGSVSLIVSMAAELGYTAPLNVALATNVAGPVEAARLARAWGAGLVHVSTCFISPAGMDTLEEAPVALSVGSASAEWQHAQELSNQLRRTRPGRRSQIEAALERARLCELPNTYAYSKWLGESVLFEQFPDLPLAVVRPSIVESAQSFPMPGWNEDFKSTAPLAWVLDGWFRAVPTRPGQLLDIIPVDDVARVIAVACAAVVEGVHHPVYHASTGARQPLTVERAARLTWSCSAPDGAPELVRSLMGQSGLVMQGSGSLSGLRSLPMRLAHVSERLSAAGKRSSGFSRPFVERSAVWVRSLHKAMDRRVRIIETYRPFIVDRAYAFACERVFEHTCAEPAFRFEPAKLDWKNYWRDVHMPGLRRWCFSAIAAGA